MAEDRVWELVSYVLGCSSVLIWLCAQAPQIYKNWRRKSVEGLSPGFLTAWIAGDVSNLLGCKLTGQLGVQLLLASYYCIVDVVLVSQFILYRPRMVVIDAYDPIGDPEGPFSTDNLNSLPRKRARGSFLGRMYEKLGSAVSLAALAKSTSAAPIDPGLNALEELSRDWSKDVGFFVAYFSMAMYLFSRVPQILHNFQRKSTTGISMLLFISAFLGNATYTLSILLAPQSIGKHANRRAFLLNELPYLVGAAGTMFFDCVILSQWYWYHRITAHHRRGTQPLDRISRPYLGESLPSSASSTPAPSRRISFSSPLPRPSRSRRKSRKYSSSSSTDLTASPLYANYGSVQEESALEEN